MDTTIFCDFGDFGDLVVLCPGGSELRSWRSQEVKGSLELRSGKLRALEEALDDFLLEAFFCQVRLFSVLLGRLWVAPGGVDLRSCRFQDVRLAVNRQPSFRQDNS